MQRPVHSFPERTVKGILLPSGFLAFRSDCHFVLLHISLFRCWEKQFQSHFEAGLSLFVQKGFVVQGWAA